jgi:hypothetical protein
MVEPGLRLSAESESVAIQPSQSKDLVFRLRDDAGKPVPDRVIQFSILDDPATPMDDGAGATLSLDRVVTSSEGVAALQIIAGPQPTLFRVRASTTRASDVEVMVFVTEAKFAPIELAPVLVDPPTTGQELTTVRLHVLDGAGCASIDYGNLPPSTLFVRTIPSDSTALFSTVNTEQTHHLVALGLDAAGVARAGGCVDLVGSLLLVHIPLRVLVPMHLFRVDAEGSYEVVSRVPLRPALRASALVTEAWRELSTCPQDPGRLWLDCTLDALKSSDSDPLDCRPTDDEGPLGVTLLARRGLPLAMPGMGQCRDKVDVLGSPSHDHLVAGLFPAQRTRLIDGLPAMGAEVTQLLDSVELRSTLTIGPTSTPGQYQLSHRLTSAAFPLPASGTSVDLRDLGAPVLEARFVPATAHVNDLEVGTHGFTLRLGSAARQAFAQASLMPRGVAPNLPAFVEALFAAASRVEGGTVVTGCGALDALLCGDVGEPRGCLAVACADGLGALRGRLDAGFQALDGDDLDFVLGGTVQAIDTDGDHQADALGGLPGGPGLWSGEVRGRGGSNLLNGTWTAVRAAPERP